MEHDTKVAARLDDLSSDPVMPSILVVDDHPANLLAVEATLDGMNVRLVTALSAEEALDKANREEFAVVLMDVRLPGMDGIDAAAAIRARHSRTPIILLTASETSARDIDRAYKGGVVDYLTKPYLPQSLRAKVSVFIELFLAREQLQRQASLLAQQNEAEQALLRLVIEQTGDGIIVSDTQGVLRVFNRAAEKMHGVTRKEMEAPAGAETYGVFTLDGRPLPLHETPLYRAVSGEIVENAAWMVKRPDGEMRVLVGTATPLRRPDGTLAGGVLLTRDETERVALEKERNDAHEARLQAITREAALALRTKAITDNASLGLVMMDARQHCTFMNPAAERIFGLSFAQVQALDRPLHDIVHHTRPDGTAYPISECPIDRALPTRANQGGEDIFVRPDGTFYPVTFTASPIVDHGVAVGTVIEVRDATEEKRIEALEARRARHALLAGDVGAALTRGEDLPTVLHQCAEAMVRHLDAAFARVWTLSTDGSVLELQASAGMYTHLDGAHARVPVGKFKIGRIAQEGQPHLTNDVPHDPLVGDKAWAQREGLVAFAGYPLLLAGRVVGVLAMFARQALAQDVLEALASVADSIALGIDRLRSEDALRASIGEQRRIVARQHLLANASKELASSLDYQVTLRNVARLAVPGLADWAAVDILDEEGQLHRLVVEHTDPEKVALAHELHRRYPPNLDEPHGLGPVLREGRSQWMADIPDALLVAGARDQEHLEISRALGLKSFLVVPLKVRDRVLGAFTLVHAESGRSYSEEDVELMEELASRAAVAVENARLFDEVRRLNQELEQRVEARTAELREANAELESFSYSVSHDLRAPLRHMIGFAQLLEKRSASVLDAKSREYVKTIADAAQRGGQLVDELLAFSRLGRAELKRGPVELSRLVAEVQGELRPDWEQRRVTWKIDPLPVVSADAGLLRSALRNLLANSLKYTRSKPEAQIAVSARESGDLVTITVQDNGVGFDMRYVDKLFGVFQRLHTAEQFEGNGIGLANVRRIVQRHGGRVWAEGAVDVGATFHFTLPKSQPHRHVVP